MLSTAQNDDVLIRCDGIDYIQHIKILTPISEDVVSGMVDISVECLIVDDTSELDIDSRIKKSLPF